MGLGLGPVPFMPTMPPCRNPAVGRTEPFVPEGYLPERQPFIPPAEPERTTDYEEDYGADEPAEPRLGPGWA